MGGCNNKMMQRLLAFLEECLRLNVRNVKVTCKWDGIMVTSYDHMEG